MEDEVFRPERRRPANDQADDAWVASQGMRDQMSTASAADRGGDKDPPFGEAPGGVEIKGTIPPQLQHLLRGVGDTQAKQPHRNRAASTNQYGAPENEHLNDLLRKLDAKTHHYEQIVLPSRGKFYDGSDGPSDGVIYLRPMTGQEEQILATPRFMKNGRAIDMIFEACSQTKLNASRLLSADRTYLLIYLRGISYTPQYEVEVKCPSCSHKYPTVIDLNSIEVNECPDDFGPDDLEGVLPTSGFKFTYQLRRGANETDVNNYRERRSKQWGDNASDDTLHYQTAMLIGDIEGITDKMQLQQMAKRLPVNDVNYIRNMVNNPPFGVDTNIEMLCPSCYTDYSVDLPLEASFFSPRPKKSS